MPGELEEFGEQLKESDLARFAMEREQLALERERFVVERTERAQERKDREVQRTALQKL